MVSAREMGVQFPLGLSFKNKKRKMKKKIDNGKRESKIVFVLVLIFVFAVLLVVVLSIIAKRSVDSKINAGELATDFCSLKCGNQLYYSSVNNTDFNFIKCRCVEGVSLGQGYEGKNAPKIKAIYFNSETLNEINYQEVKNRVKSDK